MPKKKSRTKRKADAVRKRQKAQTANARSKRTAFIFLGGPADAQTRDTAADVPRRRYGVQAAEPEAPEHDPGITLRSVRAVSFIDAKGAALVPVLPHHRDL